MEKKEPQSENTVETQNVPTLLSFPKEITIGDKYGPAMEITDQFEAGRYFEACVVHNMSFGTSRQRAEEIERQNLGYFAGYHDTGTRERVEKLFKCVHPIFGAVDSSVPDASESATASSKTKE